MLSVFVKAGGVTHDVPTKPYPVTNSRFEGFIQSFEEYLEKHEERFQQNLKIALTYESEGMEDVNEQYMAPQAGEDGFLGNVVLQDNDDPLEQDEFPTEVFNGKIPLEQIFVLPMNLQSLVDLSGNNGLSVISERFNRFAQIIPSKGGSLGPKIGKYIMDMRMPTSIAGNVEHVFIPGDMIEEAAVMAFGLSTILGMATSALSAFGGPLVSGIIETGRNLLGNLIGLGGKPTDKTNNTTSIVGDIELSRFMNFLKPAAINELVDPVNGALALKIRDVLSSGAGVLNELPARIWATMQGAGVERELFDRLILPSTSQRILIPLNRLPYILRLFSTHPSTFVEGSHQRACLAKLLKHLSTRIQSASYMCFDLQEVLQETVSEEEIVEILGSIS